MEGHRAITERMHKLVDERVGAGPQLGRGPLRCHTTIGQNDHMVRDFKCFVDIV
jgi:hypothetical protein